MIVPYSITEFFGSSDNVTSGSFASVTSGSFASAYEQPSLPEIEESTNNWIMIAIAVITAVIILLGIYFFINQPSGSVYRYRSTYIPRRPLSSTYK